MFSNFNIRGSFDTHQHFVLFVQMINIICVLSAKNALQSVYLMTFSLQQIMITSFTILSVLTCLCFHNEKFKCRSISFTTTVLVSTCG